MEENRFESVMRTKDDVELVKITTTERKDYQPKAVAAAEEELKKRGVSADMYKNFTEQVEKLTEIQNKAEERKRELPLSTWIKVVAFVFPAFLFFIIGLGLSLFGYQKRGKDLCKWTLLGCLFYLIVFLFIKLFL